jgi:hypothetical protein
VAVDLQVPVRVGSEPVVLVAVEDDDGIVRDPAIAHHPLERRLLDEVALDRILKVVTPVQLDRARDVTLVVEIRILVDLGDDDFLVVQVLGEPVRRDEHRFRISVLRHPSLLRLSKMKCAAGRAYHHSSPGVLTIFQTM